MIPIIDNNNWYNLINDNENLSSSIAIILMDADNYNQIISIDLQFELIDLDSFWNRGSPRFMWF